MIYHDPLVIDFLKKNSAGQDIVARYVCAGAVYKYCMCDINFVPPPPLIYRECASALQNLCNVCVCVCVCMCVCCVHVCVHVCVHIYARCVCMCDMSGYICNVSVHVCVCVHVCVHVCACVCVACVCV